MHFGLNSGEVANVRWDLLVDPAIENFVFYKLLKRMAVISLLSHRIESF